jgi:hypothetical protein
MEIAFLFIFSHTFSRVEGWIESQAANREVDEFEFSLEAGFVVTERHGITPSANEDDDIGIRPPFLWKRFKHGGIKN